MKRDVAAALALALAAACSGGGGDGGDDPPELEPAVAVGAADGWIVRLLADARPQVGVNALAVEVRTAWGAPVEGATVELRLRHASPAGSHGCPVVGPGAGGAGGRYPFVAVLQEPSGAGAWSGEVLVSRGGPAATVPLPAFEVVTGKDLARSFSSGGIDYVLALEFLAAPVVGLSPVAVTLHASRDQGATFAPVGDATLTLEPWMPSMGHGSEGSVDPTPVSPGWYEGKVSFSMAGPWVVTVAASRAGEPIGSPAFDVAF